MQQGVMSKKKKKKNAEKIKECYWLKRQQNSLEQSRKTIAKDGKKDLTGIYPAKKKKNKAI